ncbi:MAG TPA: discoidin domain-containing protein [Candidatus Krumholzibacteria bacterium]|nr:discoidin domain-containing protein [Candidatus Krumholzibacteria bacterium]
MRAVLVGLLLCCAVSALAASPAPSGPLVLDDGSRPELWSAHPADGVRMAIVPGQGETDAAVRMDYDFSGGGWAILRRHVGVDLPENYALRFRLRGEGPRNHLEFKFLDASGENVWWRVLRDVEFSGEWTTVTVKKRQVDFAWGPEPGPLTRIEDLEIAVTAGEGGAGSLWVDSVVLEELPPPSAAPPVPVAAASTGDGAAALDGDPASAWMPVDAAPVLDVDLGAAREFGGLTLTWGEGGAPASYRVRARLADEEWTTVWRAEGSDGGHDPVPIHEAEARHLRLELDGPAALAELELMPLAWSATREATAMAEANRVRRGLYPRGITGEQAYWTVLGPDASPLDALISEDGAVEPRPGGPSVEPFLARGDTLITWADVTVTHELADHVLPLPVCTWHGPGFELEIAPVPVRQNDRDRLSVRYTYRNLSDQPRVESLVLAVRPFQVNPPSQFLSVPGGTARVGEASVRGNAVILDGRPWLVTPSDALIRGAAASYAMGDLVADRLAAGDLPSNRTARCPHEAASAALFFVLSTPAGGEAVIDVMLALDPDDPMTEALGPVAKLREDARSGWRAALGDFRLEIPAAPEVARTATAQLGYVLVNRDGPGIQPGTRSYRRSWIRDGALTSWALLRTGLVQPAREFLEWYAPYQYDDGKIPCVVDHRGADPVPEHDSSGEFIFLVHQLVRHTGDLDLAREMWPRVRAAADYLDRLRQTRRTPEFAGTEFWGLLPPSISHEGYSAKPMHSYWDDAFAYRGFRDAARLGALLGEEDAAARYDAMADEFGADLGASVARTMEVHGIDYVPGCADLGDFDPTSTTILLSPGEAQEVLPPGAVERTFDRYWDFFTGRASGRDPWDAYTPYEVRNIGAAVRLGERDRAVAMTEWFLDDRRPAGWRHWAEVVSSQERVPRFLGDMPHTWVGSDFVRSVLSMVAYEEASSGEIVIGAGLPPAWLAGEGVTLRGLHLSGGRLDLHLRASGDGYRVTASGTAAPSGGFVLRLPDVDERRLEALPFHVVTGN